jgi:hypothetical protein
MKDLESYLETHYEIVQELTRILDREEDEQPLKFIKTHQEYGHGGLYMLAKELTDKFEVLHSETVWGYDLGWLETLEEFIEEELYS